MEEFCTLCEMQKAYCPHGNPTAAEAVAEEFSHARISGDCTQGETGPTITAQIHSECVTCGREIDLGDRITHISDGWVHARPEEEIDFGGIV